MTVGGRSDDDSTQSETANETETTDESVVEPTNINDAAEQTQPENEDVLHDEVNRKEYVLVDGSVYVSVETAKHLSIEKHVEASFVEWPDSEDADVLHKGDNRISSTVAGGTTLGATGMAVETARRLGIERHAEAGFAEQAHVEAYAKKVGGTVVDDGSSVFTPDGGIDGIVKTTSGQKYVQSKHYGQEIGNGVLEQYADDIDAFGATNGVAESADPEKYSMDTTTFNDWSWRAKAELQGRRILRGCRKSIGTLKDGMRSVANRLIDSTKFIRGWVIAGGKRFGRRLIKLGSAIGKWFARQSLGTQLVLIVAGVGLLYLLWRRNADENEGDNEP